jgi:chloride channel protein, CIC family
MAARTRVMISRLLVRMGFREESFLLLLAVLIGIVTAAAAVSFHELIIFVRDLLYGRLGPVVDLYGRGIWLLVLIPAAGGLVVGLFSRYISHTRGHGIIDVMESVMRMRGFIRPRSALETIFASSVTIGSGGSAGAEGPIVQIGAAIASGIGQFFRIARQHMPVLIGCGTAAGISAIFNSPIGGLIFTLEVILRDFSIRTITPVIIASVIANVTTQAIFSDLLGHGYDAIFSLPPGFREFDIQFSDLGGFLILGLLCGVIGVSLTRLMHFTDQRFGNLPVPQPLKPAIGGAMLGITGVMYIVLFGWMILGQSKPEPWLEYPMPAFFGDGYEVVEPMLGPAFFEHFTPGTLLLLLGFLCVIKVVATCLTLGSGGSGGVIAPSLFLGAMAGGFLGIVLGQTGRFAGIEPFVYALVGMGAVLAAVVHAPLAAILILFEVTRNYQVVLPAMLAAIVATSLAQLLFRDSVYTLSLRLRGLRVGTTTDLTVLRRLTVENVDLEPAMVVRAADPLQRVLTMTESLGPADLVVVDHAGVYAGMITAADLQTAMIEREAIPLLTAGELMRAEIPLVDNTDDLAAVLDTFTRHDVARLPVTIAPSAGRVIGLISRAGLMKRYQSALAEA